MKAMAEGGQHVEIALDADSINHRIDSLEIAAGTTSAQVQKDLEDRHAKMRARMNHRNDVRRAKLVQAGRKRLRC